MKIYTKTGDDGTTSLYHPSMRCTKADPRMDAVGAVDEFNSTLGVAISHLAEGSKTADQLEYIQRKLFKVGTNLATPEQREDTTLKIEDVLEIEAWIDEVEATLTPLTRFILPSGGIVASQLHLSRSVCRRAEREVDKLKLEYLLNDFDMSIKYLNRLSDYLFVLARKFSEKEVLV